MYRPRLRTIRDATNDLPRWVCIVVDGSKGAYRLRFEGHVKRNTKPRIPTTVRGSMGFFDSREQARDAAVAEIMRQVLRGNWEYIPL